MTYCVGMLLQEGLLLASDTRTNAGVDHIATFRKMHVFQDGADRRVVIVSAGNLATTQSVVSAIFLIIVADAVFTAIFYFV